MKKSNDKGEYMTGFVSINGGGSEREVKQKSERKRAKKPGCRAAISRAVRAILLIAVVLIAISLINAYFVNRRIYAVSPFGAFNSLNALYGMQMRHNLGFMGPLIADYSGLYGDNMPMEKRFPDNLMLKRDRKYGLIPEYWEMRPASKSISRVECLKNAVELNPNTPDTLYFGTLLELEERSKPYDTETPADPELEILVLDAIRKAAEIEPDNGAWNFLAAIELNHLGEWDESLEEMQLAYDSAEYRIPSLYPYRDLDTLAGQLFMHPKAIPDGLYAITEGEPYNYTIFSRIKDAYRNMGVVYAMAGDEDMLNLYHRCAVKNARASGNGVMGLVTSTILITIVADTFKEQIANERSPEDYAIMALQKKIGNLASDAVRASDVTPFEVTLYATIWDEFIDVSKLMGGKQYFAAILADEKDGKQLSVLGHSNTKKHWSLTKRYFARDVWLKDLLVWQYLILEQRRENVDWQLDPLLEFDYSNPLDTIESSIAHPLRKTSKADKLPKTDENGNEPNRSDFD